MQSGKYMKKQRPEETVDLGHFARALWRRMWVIVLATALCGIGTFFVSKTMINPTYQSSFTTYVNNKMEIDSMGSTSVSDLNASYGLAYVYQEIITSRSVVEEAVDYCKRNGTYPQRQNVYYSITAEVADKAPVITVYVEADDPEFALVLANAITQVAPGHVERVVEGSSMHIIDKAKRAAAPSSPDNGQNALLGAAIGMMVACLSLIALEFYMDKVQGAEDLERRYEIPVLGVIPNIERAYKAMKRKNPYEGGGRE